MRGIRTRLHFSQGRFADAFGLSVDAVRHWESGRRNPEAAARALLLVIAHDPHLVMRALAQPQKQLPVPGQLRHLHRAAVPSDPLLPDDGARVKTYPQNPFAIPVGFLWINNRAIVIVATLLLLEGTLKPATLEHLRQTRSRCCKRSAAYQVSGRDHQSKLLRT